MTSRRDREKHRESSIEMLLAAARRDRGPRDDEGVYLDPATLQHRMGQSRDEVWPDAFVWSPGDPV